MAKMDIDLLALIIVSRSQSKKLMANLNKKQFYFTLIDSSSSLFHEATDLLLLGFHHTRMDTLNKLVQKYCQPFRKFVPVQIHASGEISHLPVLESIEGGAILYGMPVEYFEQI